MLVSSSKSKPFCGRALRLKSYLFPSVQRLVVEYNINPESIRSTGKNKRILKGDVVKFIKEKNLSAQKKAIQWPQAAPAQSSPPQTPTKLATGPKPTLAKSIPHQYIAQSIRVDNFSKFIKQLHDADLKVTREDVLVKCVSLALNEVKEVNVQWSDATGEGELRAIVAVSVLGQDGRQFEIESGETKGLDRILQERTKLLEGSAVDAKGSVCICDFGSNGVTSLVPIVRSPQVAVISIGGENSSLVLDPELHVETVSQLSLSFDARCVDFEAASKFLLRVANYIESPNDLYL